MTTEEDFQRMLDKHPEDWQTRLIFADWLEERGDPRAEGYRALGEMRRHPIHYRVGRRVWQFLSSNNVWSRINEGGFLPFALPLVWIKEMDSDSRVINTNTSSGWREYLTRREAEDEAALAYSRLSVEDRKEVSESPLMVGR